MPPELPARPKASSMTEKIAPPVGHVEDIIPLFGDIHLYQGMAFFKVYYLYP